MPFTPTVVWSLTSTMWPEDMRPPFAREWMRVSSRSITRVFCKRVEEEDRCEGDAEDEYEGWRRGMRGRGGAGARGYLVRRRDAAGEVGDLRAAAAADVCWVSVVFPVGFFGRFKLERAESSFLSLIRIDLRVGVASSVNAGAFALGRIVVLRFLPSFPCSPKSVSDSEVTDDAESIVRSRWFCEAAEDFGRFVRDSAFSPRTKRSEDPESPTACAVELLPLRPGNFLPIFRNGVSGEKCPPSS